MGHCVSHRMVDELLREAGYSLQGNRKAREEGSDHPCHRRSESAVDRPV
jgi:hypothetical protein